MLDESKVLSDQTFKNIIIAQLRMTHTFVKNPLVFTRLQASNTRSTQ